MITQKKKKNSAKIHLKEMMGLGDFNQLSNFSLSKSVKLNGNAQSALGKKRRSKEESEQAIGAVNESSSKSQRKARRMNLLVESSSQNLSSNEDQKNSHVNLLRDKNFKSTNRTVEVSL